jgi:hypothetical protein
VSNLRLVYITNGASHIDQLNQWQEILVGAIHAQPMPAHDLSHSVENPTHLKANRPAAFVPAFLYIIFVNGGGQRTDETSIGYQFLPDAILCLVVEVLVEEQQRRVVDRASQDRADVRLLSRRLCESGAGGRAYAA